MGNTPTWFPQMPLPHTLKLLEIIARLRDPATGCPWDVEQNFASISPYTIEEAYEVADAIERGDMADLREELGDLLLQVVFHAQMAAEAGLFTFEDVAASIGEKLVRRHPHVFVERDARTADEQVAKWEEIKAEERGEKSDPSALAGVALALPALQRAQKLQKRAAKVGFDWPDLEPVFEKFYEEITELREALARKEQADISEEMGDTLFACVNIARHAGVEAEEALRATNKKFERRFRHVETRLTEREKTCEQATLEEMDALWEEAKKWEKQ